MDVNMPRLGGIEATRRIKLQMPQVNVIGLSIFSADDMRIAMQAAGATAYLSKDRASATLCDAIRTAVQKEVLPA